MRLQEMGRLSDRDPVSLVNRCKLCRVSSLEIWKFKTLDTSNHSMSRLTV
jgi:hypothetical protein